MTITGSISLPGDKSISHRALMIASLSPQISTIKNLSNGKDIQSTEHCLKLCGISIKENSKKIKVVKGDTFYNPSTELNCGNSGTTMRLLSGLLPSRGIEATLIGDSSLSKRPMERILKPLSQMGVNIKCINNRSPIIIKKSKISGINYSSKISSAQVKSAILFSGLGSSEPVFYQEPFLSRDHTEVLLKAVGVTIKMRNNKICLSPPVKSLKPLNIEIPGDPSSASFFAGAASILPKSNLILKKILSNPTRFQFFNIIRLMGADMSLTNEGHEAGEKVTDITINSGNLMGIEIQADKIPSIIDEIPMLAVIATQAIGKTVIRGAEELRVKESDRINAIVINLRKMGASVEEYDDGFAITGPTKLKGANIETFNDHRIAMAFVVAGLVANGNTKLDNYDCVDISFPGFFKMMRRLIK
jgi:3-phosphoshikimate 1-carboxyvinyltransferase